MQFNSLEYALFFIIVVFVYFFIPKKARTVWLLIASYYFYMNWNAVYAILIGISTVSTYACGLLLGKKENKYNKLILTTGIFFNLSILGIYKYSSFFIDSINYILRQFNLSELNIYTGFLLPVGISFYTFQAVGYLIDVYRDESAKEKNIINYGLYIAFFPQLVAGPIERTKNILCQIRNIKNLKVFDYDRIISGTIIIIWGLFLKMVIADRTGILVDYVFDNFRMLGSVELILGAIGFSLQIYCDFFSYSLIALGSARILGIKLMENFNTPYFSESIGDFWNRWHISLSSWFRDYLYIPLGGNRKGDFRRLINIMIIFIVSGLWHGASWNFVFWGFLHGLYRVTGIVSNKFRKRIVEYFDVNTKCFSWRLLKIFSTFALVTIAWIFFRAENISDGMTYISRIFTRPDFWKLLNNDIYGLGLSVTEMNILLFSVCLLAVISLVKYVRGINIDEFLNSQNLWFKWFAIILIIVMVFVFGEYGSVYNAKQFIYFQF